jgi:hypothetical protein
VNVVEDVYTDIAEKPPPAGAVLAQVVPLLVSTLPEELGAIACRAEVPFPSKTLFAVKVEEPVPPFATGRVPVTPVVNGSPVKFVAMPEVGVPSKGVVNWGLVASATTVPVPDVV